MKPALSGRSFLRTSLVAVAGVGPVLSAVGHPANQPVRLGIIGCGGRGRQLIQIFPQFPNVDVAAISDVIEPRLDQATALLTDAPVKPERFVDYKPT